MSNSSNLTDPCAAGSISLSTPRTTLPGAYVAIGPISNFSSAVGSCCNTYANNTFISNYAGGEAPSSCYYYCVFNGTVEDMGKVMACQNGAASERRRAQGGDGSGFLAIGSHPDLDDRTSAGASVFESPKMGVWRSVVLGLAFFGAMAGTL